MMLGCSVLICPQMVNFNYSPTSVVFLIYTRQQNNDHLPPSIAALKPVPCSLANYRPVRQSLTVNHFILITGGGGGGLAKKCPDLSGTEGGGVPVVDL